MREKDSIGEAADSGKDFQVGALVSEEVGSGSVLEDWASSALQPGPSSADCCRHPDLADRKRQNPLLVVGKDQNRVHEGGGKGRVCSGIRLLPLVCLRLPSSF